MLVWVLFPPSGWNGCCLFPSFLFIYLFFFFLYNDGVLHFVLEAPRKMESARAKEEVAFLKEVHN